MDNLYNTPTPRRTQSKVNSNSPNMEKSANDIEDITNNFNYVVLIHTKNHQNNDFDAFTQSNQLADNRAKMLQMQFLQTIFQE